MSSPHLVLEVQVVKLLEPMLGPSLHLEVLQVRLVLVVLGELVALVVVTSVLRNRLAGIPNVNITSMRMDVAASASGLDGSYRW